MGAVNTERALDVADVHPDPMVQFRRWFADAEAAAVPEPEAMCLTTVSADAVPSARMVLLKGIDDQGFLFFTNYQSQKAREAAANPAVALVWRWHTVERQVRAVGLAERASPEESDSYFATRPRGAQIGAWASPQSQAIVERAQLIAWVQAVEKRFGDGPIIRPPWWGGIRVVPNLIEFWQGRPSRLHDRLRYRRSPEPGVWDVERLAP